MSTWVDPHILFFRMLKIKTIKLPNYVDPLVYSVVQLPRSFLPSARLQSGRCISLDRTVPTNSWRSMGRDMNAFRGGGQITRMGKFLVATGLIFLDIVPFKNVLLKILNLISVLLEGGLFKMQDRQIA